MSTNESILDTITPERDDLVTRLQKLTGKERTTLDDLYQINAFDFELGIQAMEDSENTEDWNNRRALVLRRYEDRERNGDYFRGWIDGTGLIVSVLGQDAPESLPDWYRKPKPAAVPESGTPRKVIELKKRD